MTVLFGERPTDAGRSPGDEAWRTFARVIAGQLRVRESRDGGRNYRRVWERALTDVRPRVPAAVRTYGADGTLSCLSADFDISRGGPSQVDVDASRFAGLIARCGGATFADQSPNGGRHVYAPLREPVPFNEARRVALALAMLFPSLDPGPLLNLTEGCIRPPGSIHKTRGEQRLTTQLSAAVAVASTKNARAVWDRLVETIAPQLAQVDAAADTADSDPPLRPGGVPARALPAAYAEIARTGRHTYSSDSEARQAVVTSALARGWELRDIVRQLETGAWPGLASFYARYRPGSRRKALLLDVRNATAFLRSHPAVRKSHTSEPLSHRGQGAGRRTAPEDEHRFIREWRTALRLLEGRRYGSQRAGLTSRFLLRALAESAHKRGGRYVAFGTRSLALAAGVDHSTVARRLRALAAEPDPMIVCLESHRGLRGDLYELRIPDEFAGSAAARAWPAGKAHALRPAFRELGPVAALVYETLEGRKVACSRFDIAEAAYLSPSAAAEALRVLAEFGLAVPADGKWRHGSASLTAVAQALGIPELVEALVRRYALERAAWRALMGALPRPLTLAGESWAPTFADDVDVGPWPLTAIELCEQILGAHVVAQYRVAPNP